MSGVDDSMLFAHARVQAGDDVTFTPFIHPNGYVGFRVEDSEGRVDHIYLNPSDDPCGPDDVTVFLYTGVNGDPVDDEPHHYYTMFEGYDS